MKEAAFVKNNKQKWLRYEEKLKHQRDLTPDELAQLYIDLTDDLSFARTHYPDSELVNYLNQMASGVHQGIYKNKKEEKGRFKRFWLKELPETMATVQKALLISFIIFMVSMTIGWVSAANDTTFVRLILSDAYVNMTEKNIEKGDPLAVYKSMKESIMFVGITINNVMVSFRTFAAGVFTAVGTGFMIFRNGVMVGAFVEFFFEQNLGFTAIMIIMIHGTLELSAIVIAGAAGITMGNSILFPGSYTRLESFKRGAKKGLKIVIGLVPVFFIAGWIEGYITRLTEMPLFLRYVIIGGSAVFILYYFIILPNKIRIDARQKEDRTLSGS